MKKVVLLLLVMGTLFSCQKEDILTYAGYS
mgnify:CR=1 FL=1